MVKIGKEKATDGIVQVDSAAKKESYLTYIHRRVRLIGLDMTVNKCSKL
ncbi:hypothetical protein W03_04810 [Nitrosomonas sp. PY1]|nr:hypothetical protein W03_04810 [Nitrosomonas sp. PY1]